MWYLLMTRDCAVHWWSADGRPAVRPYITLALYPVGTISLPLTTDYGKYCTG
jgi:hypothetical protein